MKNLITIIFLLFAGALFAQPVRTTITDDGVNVTVQTPVNMKVIPICDFHWAFTDGNLQMWIEGRNELIPGGRLGNFTINGATTQAAKLAALGAISAECSTGGGGGGGSGLDSLYQSDGTPIESGDTINLDITAAEVPIIDAGGYFSSTNVEGALQEVGLAFGGAISALPPGPANPLDTINGFSLSGPDGFTVADIVENAERGDVYTDSSNILTKPLAYATASASGISGLYDWDVKEHPHLVLSVSGITEIYPKNATKGEKYSLTIVNDGIGRIVNFAPTVLTSGTVSPSPNAVSYCDFTAVEVGGLTKLIGVVTAATAGSEMDFLATYKDSIDFAVFAALGGAMQQANGYKARVNATGQTVWSYHEPTKYANRWTMGATNTAPVVTRLSDNTVGLKFDGSNDWLQATGSDRHTHIINSAGDWTLLMKFRKVTDGVLDMLGSQKPDGATNGWRLTTTTGNAINFLIYNTSSGTPSCNITTSTTVTAADGWVTVYVTGRDADTTVTVNIIKAGVTTSTSGTTTNAALTTASNIITIGNQPSASNQFDGYINAFLIFNRRISTACLSALTALPLSNFSTSTVVAQSPYVHYDISSGSLYQDDAKTTAATANNDPIQRVVNQVGGWRVTDMDVQGTGNFTLKTNVQNGLKAALVDNVHYSTLNGATELTDYTMFVVFRATDTTTALRAVVANNSGAHEKIMVNNTSTYSGSGIVGKERAFIASEPIDSMVMVGANYQLPYLQSEIKKDSFNVLHISRKGTNTFVSVNGGELTKLLMPLTHNSVWAYFSYNNSAAALKGYLGEIMLYEHWMPSEVAQAKVTALATKWGVALDGPRLDDDHFGNNTVVVDGKDGSALQDYVSFPAAWPSSDGRYIWVTVRRGRVHGVDASNAGQCLQLYKIDHNGVVQPGFPDTLWLQNVGSGGVGVGDGRDAHGAFLTVVNNDGIGEDSLLINLEIYPSPVKKYVYWRLPNGSYTTPVNYVHPNTAGRDANWFPTDEIIRVGSNWYNTGYFSSSGDYTINVLKSVNNGATWTQLREWATDTTRVPDLYPEEPKWQRLPNGDYLLMFRNDTEGGSTKDLGVIGTIRTSNIDDWSAAVLTDSVAVGIATPGFDIAPDGEMVMFTRSSRIESRSIWYYSKDLGYTWTYGGELNPWLRREQYERQMYGYPVWLSKTNGKNVFGIVYSSEYKAGDRCRMYLNKVVVP